METNRGKLDSLSSDVLKTAVPLIVPIATQMIIALVPEGSKLDDVLDKYSQYWDKIVPIVTIMVLRFTDMPSIVDDVVVQLSARVAIKLKEKYSDSAFISTKEIRQKQSQQFLVKDIVTLLPTEDFGTLMSLVEGKDSSSLNKFFNYSLGSTESSAIKMLTNLSKLEQFVFNIWFNTCFPENIEEKKKELDIGEGIKNTVKTVLENDTIQNVVKKFSDRVGEIEQSYDDYFSKPTLFENIARKIDFLGLMGKPRK